VRLSSITHYACYYGWGRLAQLATYDMVILQAAAYGPQDIAWLEAQGTRTLAYLSVGEVPSDEAHPTWMLNDPATGAPILKRQWGTVLVDCRSPQWQEHLLDVSIPGLLSQGVTGLFLDTVDVQDSVPATRQGVVELLQRVRLGHPEAVLLVNRGFSIMEAVLAVADGVLFEAFTTHYDGNDYAAWEGTDLAWTGATAMRLRQASPHMPVFALDYARPGDPTLRDRAERRARAYDMHSFVAPYRLDWLPEGS
jgi:polysaccharide biosynthesis protein PelA